MWNIKEKLFLHYKKDRLTLANMPLIIVFRLLGYVIGVWVVICALLMYLPLRAIELLAHACDWLGKKLHWRLLRECNAIIDEEIMQLAPFDDWK